MEVDSKHYCLCFLLLRPSLIGPDRGVCSAVCFSVITKSEGISFHGLK